MDRVDKLGLGCKVSAYVGVAVGIVAVGAGMVLSKYSDYPELANTISSVIAGTSLNAPLAALNLTCAS